MQSFQYGRSDSPHGATNVAFLIFFLCIYSFKLTKFCHSLQIFVGSTLVYLLLYCLLLLVYSYRNHWFTASVFWCVWNNNIALNKA